MGAWLDPCELGAGRREMELMAYACPFRAESFPGKGPLSADGWGQGWGPGERSPVQRYCTGYYLWSFSRDGLNFMALSGSFFGGLE